MENIGKGKLMVLGSIPIWDSWNFGEKNFYHGIILTHSFYEPLGIKYYGLDTPVLGIQYFIQIHFGGECPTRYVSICLMIFSLCFTIKDNKELTIGQQATMYNKYGKRPLTVGTLQD